MILAEKEKEDMEFELGMHGIEFRGSHVVCRCAKSVRTVVAWMR